LDLFPTFLSIAGAKPPVNRRIDGQDLSPVLFENGKRNGTDFYLYFRDQLQAHRHDNWKLKLADKPNDPPALYDLAKDPGESADLAKDHPDLVKQMRDRMTRFDREAKL
jgi:arylsulfatase A-like enzyme